MKHTLATISTATGQELFDQIGLHLLKQGKQSLSPANEYWDDRCMYRSGDLCCAFGCIISDAEYNLEFENKPIHQILFDVGVTLHPKVLTILERLQGIHDGVDPCDWLDSIRTLAFEKRLNTEAFTPF